MAHIQPISHTYAPILKALHDDVNLPWERPWSEKAYEQTLELLTTVALGVFDNQVFGDYDKLQAFLIATEYEGGAEILFLMTAPAARNKGHAETLLRHFLKNGAFNTVFLEVCTENTHAIMLYEKMGFQRTGLRKGYYHVPGSSQSYDALTMTWERE